jgi:hypothetical protein
MIVAVGVVAFCYAMVLLWRLHWWLPFAVVVPLVVTLWAAEVTRGD